MSGLKSFFLCFLLFLGFFSFAFLSPNLSEREVITEVSAQATGSATRGDIQQIDNKLDGVLGFFDPGKALGDLVKNIIGFVIKTLTSLVGGNPDKSAYLPNEPPRDLAFIYENYGALGAVGAGVQGMYDNPPVTTADYLATINPIAPAFAQQRDGRAVLTPLQSYWMAARNLAYIFFILIIATAGLMIMFRSKIDPRTTVTVTAALPNLVIALVLITFSLAFAGFIIDIGRILMEVIKNILAGSLTGEALTPKGFNPVELSPTSIWQAFILNFNNNVSFGTGFGDIVGFLVTLIVMVFAFIVGIQVFIMLLFRYINLLVKPIFAPFVFLIGALPGKGNTEVTWFKSYLVDALTFPIVFLFLNLAQSIKNFTCSTPAQCITTNDPFGFLASGSNLNSLIAIGIVFLATKVPAFLEDAFDVKPSGHVEKAGAQPGQMLKQVPIIKNVL